MITIFIAHADLSAIDTDKPTVGGHIRIDGGKMPSLALMAVRVTQYFAKTPPGIQCLTLT